MVIRDFASPSPRPTRAAGNQEPASEPRDRVDLQAVLAATAREAASLEKKLHEHVPGEVLVKLEPGLQADGLASDYGLSVAHRFEFPAGMMEKMGGELVKLKLPEGMSTAQAIAALGHDERVAYACPNDVRRAFGEQGTNVPNDLDARLWGLNNSGQDGGKVDADIDAPEAWTLTTGSRSGGAVIAVIDTGIDYSHPDLANNAWVNPGEIPGNGVDDDGNGVVDDVHGYNAITGSGDPMDDNSHGSHCSGTIGAEGNNGQGVVGVNWQARIMGAKFLSGSGGGTVEDQIKAIAYATQMGARITSNSYGGGGFSQAEYDALAASPAMHVCAAGNDGSDTDSSPSFPASYDLANIVAVAATDRNDQLASFSNWGAVTVDLAAPGVDILSTTPGGNYRSFSGTSMATPHVAGVAGLIATAYPDATNEQIKARLMGGVDPVAGLAGKMVSGGRLNAANALDNDALAPAAPNDFAAAETLASRVALRWTATGDDGWCGRASAYDLRMSQQPITDQAAFEAATPVATGAPGETGTIESASVSLVPSGQERTVHFGLRVRDNVGNLSELRTLQVTVPAASVAFEDSMDGGAENWSAQGTWGQVDEPGRGKVWTDSPGGDYGNDQDLSLTSRP
ncbi:MAG: S8 family serine peptidase, partial [Candidatus Eremiobacterota bacterium]